jgi:hypothetical protein
MVYQSSTCIENNQTVAVFCLHHGIHSPKNVSLFGPFLAKPVVHLGVCLPQIYLGISKTHGFFLVKFSVQSTNLGKISPIG